MVTAVVAGTAEGARDLQLGAGREKFIREKVLAVEVEVVHELNRALPKYVIQEGLGQTFRDRNRVKVRANFCEEGSAERALFAGMRVTGIFKPLDGVGWEGN